MEKGEAYRHPVAADREAIRREARIETLEEAAHLARKTFRRSPP